MRASPLPADERRRAIIEATKPLLIDHGDKVTTKQIAEAAGIAEGTIFRVFANKDELIEAVLDDLTDPSRICAMISATGGRATLAEQIEVLMDRVLADIATISRLMPYLHQRRARSTHEQLHKHRPPAAAPVLEAATKVLEPFAAQLSVTPAQAAWLIETVLLSMAVPHTPDSPFSSSAEIAQVLLAGIQLTDKE